MKYSYVNNKGFISAYFLVIFLYVITLVTVLSTNLNYQAKTLENLEPDDKKIFYLRWGEHTGYDGIQVWHIMESGDTGYLYRHSKQIYRRREVILDALASLLFM